MAEGLQFEWRHASKQLRTVLQSSKLLRGASKNSELRNQTWRSLEIPKSNRTISGMKLNPTAKLCQIWLNRERCKALDFIKACNFRISLLKSSRVRDLHRYSLRKQQS